MISIWISIGANPIPYEIEFSRKMDLLVDHVDIRHSLGSGKLDT